MSDILADVRAALAEHDRFPDEAFEIDSECACAICAAADGGDESLMVVWLRALVARCEQAEASYQEAQVRIAGLEAERDHYRNRTAEESVRANGWMRRTGEVEIERDAARAEAERMRDEKEHLFGLLVRLDPLFHGSNYDTGCTCHRCVTVREVRAELESPFDGGKVDTAGMTPVGEEEQ